MDDHRFDAFTRRFASSTTRRSAVKTLIGGVLSVAAIPRVRANAQVTCTTETDCGPCETCDEGLCEPILLICEGGQRTCCLLFEGVPTPACAECCEASHCDSPSECLPAFCSNGTCEVISTCGAGEDCCEDGTCRACCDECCSDDDCPGQCAVCVNDQCADDVSLCPPCHFCDAGTCVANQLACPEGELACCNPFANTLVCAECCHDSDCPGECGVCEFDFIPAGSCISEDSQCGPCEVCTSEFMCELPDKCADGGLQCCINGFIQCAECCGDDDCSDACSICEPWVCVGDSCTEGGICRTEPDCCIDDHDCPKDECCCAVGGSCSADCCNVICHDDRHCPPGKCCCKDGSCSAECCKDHGCRHDRDCPKGTCCCHDGSCDAHCCDHPDKDPDPKLPEIHTLPSTGAGTAGDRSAAIGAAAIAAAAAYVAGRAVRERPAEASIEEQ